MNNPKRKAIKTKHKWEIPTYKFSTKVKMVPPWIYFPEIPFGNIGWKYRLENGFWRRLYV